MTRMAGSKMEMQDTLANATVRLNGLDDLARGIPIINRLLGLAIPIPRIERWIPDVLAGDAFADPDLYYGQLLGAIFDSRIEDPTDWLVLMAHYNSLLVTSESLDEVFARAVEMSTLSDEAIINEASQSLIIEPLQLMSVFDKRSFVSVKINHAYWEELTVMAFNSAGKLPYIRDALRSEAYSRSRIDDVLVKALRKQQESAAREGYPAGSFCNPHFSLGISFGNGDYPAHKYLSIPIGPIHKGAAIGSLSFLKGKFPAAKYNVADGSAAKELIWRDESDEFFARITALSDVVVFIVPTHLRNIEIKQWKGPATTIVLPAVRVYALWPAVLPDVAGKLATLFAQSGRVSVVVQAGVVAAILGILVDLMRDAYPDTQIRFFDLGQVLDIATFPVNPVGTWIQQPWIQEKLIHKKRFAISLRE